MPDEPDVLAAMGRAQAASGNTNQAIATFNKLVQIVWTGCQDEPDFGYDPVNVSAEPGGTNGSNPTGGTRGMSWKTTINQTRKGSRNPRKLALRWWRATVSWRAWPRLRSWKLGTKSRLALAGPQEGKEEQEEGFLSIGVQSLFRCFRNWTAPRQLRSVTRSLVSKSHPNPPFVPLGLTQ